jgi:hypothetical protein
MDLIKYRYHLLSFSERKYVKIKRLWFNTKSEVINWGKRDELIGGDVDEGCRKFVN